MGAASAGAAGAVGAGWPAAGRAGSTLARGTRKGARRSVVAAPRRRLAAKAKASRPASQHPGHMSTARIGSRGLDDARRAAAGAQAALLRRAWPCLQN